VQERVERAAAGQERHAVAAAGEGARELLGVEAGLFTVGEGRRLQEDAGRFAARDRLQRRRHGSVELQPIARVSQPLEELLLAQLDQLSDQQVEALLKDFSPAHRRS